VRVRRHFSALWELARVLAHPLAGPKSACSFPPRVG